MPETDIPIPSLPEPGDTPETATQDTPAAADAPPGLEELLKAAELKAAEHHDAWLRAKAEAENVRRRAQDDIAKAGKFAAERFAGELLAVKDSLEAALASEGQDAAALRSGVELTLKQLVAAFEKSGLAEINPLEEKFDPHRHQAISQIESEGEPNRVLQVLQKGYTLYERVIRPAMVIVSKAKPAA
jgi:molecular chaperone GrpE